MQRLRDDLYGGNYVPVESVGATPAGGTLEGKLAFQMITSDDLWRYTLEFLGPDKEEEEDEEEVDDDDGEEEDDDGEEEDDDGEEDGDDDDEKEDEEDEDSEAGARKRKRRESK